MKYFIFVILSLIFWLIHPLLGWIAFLLCIAFLFFKKKLNKEIILVFILLFSCLTYLANYKENKKEGTYVGIVLKSKENYILFSSSLTTYYVYFKENELEQGDIISIKGYREELDFVCLESEFDFTNYLKTQNVKYTLNCTDFNYYFKNPFRVKYLQKTILNCFSSKYHDLISTLIFASGDKLATSLSNLGIYSFLTSSGIIFYLIIKLLKRILERFFSEKKSKIISYIFTFPLIFLSAFKIGIIKTYLISLNYDFKLHFKKESIYISLLLLELFINPLYLKTSSFVYAFLLPYLIYYLYESVDMLAYKYQNIMKYFLIQVILLPILLFYNQKYSLFSFFYIYFLKYIFLILYLMVYLIVLLPFLSPFLSIIYTFISFFINLLNLININLHFYYINEIFILLLIFFIVFMLISFERNNKKIAFISLGIILGLVCFSSSEVIVNFDSYVSFINVGQGDAALIHDRNVNVLIDTGGLVSKDISNEVLIPYFNKRGIKKIDHIFISHDDFDHAGALGALLSSFPVDSYIKGCDFTTYQVKHLTFYNLNTFSSGADGNDASSVIKFTLHNNTYLFTGDITSSLESQIMEQYDVDADILKVAHHGSASSSSLSFLQAVTPRLAIISVGKNNTYNHPAKIVLKRLEQLNIKYLRTDIEGTITLNHKFNFPLLLYFFTNKFSL